jgi:hypothetical protein
MTQTVLANDLNSRFAAPQRRILDAIRDEAPSRLNSDLSNLLPMRVNAALGITRDDQVAEPKGQPNKIFDAER